MKQLLLLFFFSFSPTLVIFQDSPVGLLAQGASFPESWEGKWAGTLEIFTPTGKAREVPMELHIMPTLNRKDVAS